MKKFLFENRINFLFLFISFLCISVVLGLENIPFQNTSWLYGNNDAAAYQLGWYFFQNDIWRFPIGKNPNYGDAISSSIVYTDSIPLLAFFFKLIRNFIPGNFQYYSFWYFLCFFFQLFFAYKILKKFTQSDLYSLVATIFFITAPIFIFKINWHGSVAMGGLLLCALYLGLTKKVNECKLYWIYLIIISSLIEYSSMIIVIAVYSFLRILDLNFKKESFFQITKDFFLISFILLTVLYVAGYFEVRMVDTLGVGFGSYKLNLLSPFDPVQTINNISWSWFLPDIKLTREEELEAFNYFGIGQLLMLLTALVFFLKNRKDQELLDIRNNKKIKSFIYISIFFTFWALSNKISFGSYTLIEIPLNKYIFAILSIAKNTGRMFWIVNYFLLILSIVVLYKCFKKKSSLILISLFLLIQIADTSAGIKERINFFTPVKQGVKLEDPTWKNLFEKHKIVNTTYPVSWSRLFMQFAYDFEINNIQKTNLVIQARINRKAAAESRYLTYENFRNKNLSSETLYLIDNLSHLINLKYIFKNDDVGFFYKDKVWSMSLNSKNQMNANDKKLFNKIKPRLLEINKIIDLNFNEIDNFTGFGWSHNFAGLGVWSEGPESSLFFRTKEANEDLKLIIDFMPYLTKKNKYLEMDIYINDSFNEKIRLTKRKDKKLEILIKKDLIKNNEIKIDFKFTNIVSPYDVLESPDSRELGILLKKMKITKNL